MYTLLAKLTALVFMLTLLLSDLKAQTFTAEEEDDGILISNEGQPVLFFNTALKNKDGEYTRSNYVHPLYGLDGTVLTEDFPEDHPHHRGIYWAWVQVHIGSQRIGDLWHTRNIVAEVEDAFTMETEEGTIQLYSIAHWKSPDWNDGAPFVQDSAVLTVHPRKANYYMVDFNIYLTGLTDSVLIGGTESEKEYSGFIARLNMPENIIFNSNGEVSPENAAVKAGTWMEFSGDFSADTKGIVIIAHPENPEPNNMWVLRAKGSTQNAVYPGWRTVSVPQNNSLNLKYRVVVHDGSLDKKAIENMVTTYAK